MQHYFPNLNFSKEFFGKNNEIPQNISCTPEEDGKKGGNPVKKYNFYQPV